MVINHDLQLPFTMDAHQMTNPYQATILRTDVNRAIPSFIPEILEESNLAMDETLESRGDSKRKLFGIGKCLLLLPACRVCDSPGL